MRTTFLVAAVAFTLLAGTSQAQTIHAHRGGSVLDGVPTFAEETMPAFRYAWEQERAVLELDVKLTKDRVPVVIHDDTLDRTTTCTGAVSDVDLRQFLTCRADVLGSGLKTAPSPPGVTLPTVAEALAYARDAGATVNLEIKNIPGDNDFDPSSAYTDTVMDAVVASRLPKERLIVQSFWPPNLDAARAKLPGVELSFLTLAQGNEGGIDVARQRGYQWVSPGGVPSKSYVDRAKAAGLKVVPYTLNDADSVRAAAAAGVHALITDDPVMARRALGRPDPPPPRSAPAPPPAPGSAVAPPRRFTARATMSRRGRFVRVRVTLSAPATVSLRLTRRGRTVDRRTLRLGAGTRTLRFRVKRSRPATGLAAFAITAGGDVVRFGARARRR